MTIDTINSSTDSWDMSKIRQNSVSFKSA
jgi:hypothetical protein